MRVLIRQLRPVSRADRRAFEMDANHRSVIEGASHSGEAYSPMPTCRKPLMPKDPGQTGQCT